MRIKSVWDDFEKNGQETNLDELDRLFLGMDAGETIYGIRMESSRSPSPPLMSVADLVHCTSTQLGGRGPGESLMQDILTKAHLIDILREREQLQRSARNVKKIISCGSVVTSKSKTATGKVCDTQALSKLGS